MQRGVVLVPTCEGQLRHNGMHVCGPEADPEVEFRLRVELVTVMPPEHIELDIQCGHAHGHRAVFNLRLLWRNPDHARVAVSLKNFQLVRVRVLPLSRRPWKSSDVSVIVNSDCFCGVAVFVLILQVAVAA